MSNRRVTAIVTLAGLMDLCLAGGCHVADRVRGECHSGYSNASDCEVAAAPGTARITDSQPELEPEVPVVAPAPPEVEITKPDVPAPKEPNVELEPKIVEDRPEPMNDDSHSEPARDPVVVDKPADDLDFKSPGEIESERKEPEVSKSEEPVKSEPSKAEPQKTETVTSEPKLAPVPPQNLEIVPEKEKEPVASKGSNEGIVALKKSGAVIKFDKSWDPFTDTETPETVIGLDLSNAQFSDKEIASLKGMKNLRELDLSGTQVGDESIKQVLELGSLELLWLNGTKVTDGGIESLAGLTGLKSLGLANTSIGDDGVKHLSAMKNLEYLLLAHTKVTDGGIEHIRALSHLKGLSLMGTDVTEAGAKKLREALPNCQVVLDPKNEQGALPLFRKRPFAKMPKIVAATRVSREPKAIPVPEPKMLHGGFNISGGPEVSRVSDEVNTARSLHAEGQTLAADERWSEAARVLTKAANIAPNDVHIQHHLGVALARSGNVEAAMPHFVKSVGEAEAHYNLGVILYEDGKLEASELQLVQALRKNPDLALAQEQLDDVRLELKAARTVGRAKVRTISN